MRKLLACILLCTTLSRFICAQQISSAVHLAPGKTYMVTMEINNTITQQAASQAIGLTATGQVVHSYKVVSASPSTTTLHHSLQLLRFGVDGMGQARSFDSRQQKDRKGSIGTPLEEILSKKYDLVVDTAGNTVQTIPDKIDNVSCTDPTVILNDMIRDLSAVAYPPQKGSAGFFHILPSYTISVGDSWKDSSGTANQPLINTYTLSAISDSTIIISFTIAGSSKTNTEIMGTHAITRMNHTGSGTIIIDKASGILREKKLAMDSNGSMEAMNTSVPVTGRLTVIIQVTVM